MLHYYRAFTQEQLDHLLYRRPSAAVLVNLSGSFDECAEPRIIPTVIGGDRQPRRQPAQEFSLRNARIGFDVASDVIHLQFDLVEESPEQRQKALQKIPAGFVF